jgi:hypothetical protein
VLCQTVPNRPGASAVTARQPPMIPSAAGFKRPTDLEWRPIMPSDHSPAAQPDMGRHFFRFQPLTNIWVRCSVMIGLL